MLNMLEISRSINFCDLADSYADDKSGNYSPCIVVASEHLVAEEDRSNYYYDRAYISSKVKLLGRV